MKKILLLALLFQAFLITKAQLIYNPSVHSVAANPYLYLDIKTDFGALGNDSNDHEAFIAAASFINARGGHCQLNIPAGIYRVGKQTINGNIGWGNFHWIGQHVFALNNIDSVNIIGQFDLVTNKPTSILQYIDSLKYGVFNPATNLPYYSMAASTYNFDSVAHIGICVYLVNSTRVSIKNLLLDGNFYPGKMQLGGKFGDQGWQIDHVGFYVSGKCGGISINNCESNRFGKDGISISTLDTLIYSDTSVRLSNCKFIKNGRQALSWEAGRNLYVFSCNFDSTAFGEVPGSPGCGFDVEGDNGICANGYFNKCTFEQNAGAGFSAFVGSSTPYLVSGLYFDSCRLNRYAVTQYRPKTVFKSCEIYGSIDGNYGDTANAQDATKYKNCLFSDCFFTQQTYQNNTLGVPLPINSSNTNLGYSISSSSNNSDNIRYSHCKFENYYGQLFSISNDLPIMPANHNIYLDTCTFSNYVKIDDFINGYNLFYKSCMFNIPGTGSPLQSGCYYIWGTEPSQNTLINPIYNFWDCSGTPPQCTAPLIEFISTHTTCNTYNISANVHGVFGNLRYLWSNGATTSSISNVAAGTYSVKVWNHLYYTLIDSITITNPPALIANSTLSDVSCATASDGSIQLTATGGTPSYTYNWSNAATTQNLTNLAAGNYSCIVTDANGCTATVNNLTINAPSGAYCCNTNYTNYPTHILADNISSSTLAQSTYSNTAIMVNGIFTIDNNLTLNNCQLYFTENALIQLSPNYTLTLNNCTLQAGCAVMWDGIYANDPTEQIVLNNCTISDMQQGLVLSNLAKLNITGNTFTDNYKCILFNNIVGAYNSTLGNCIVRKNIFTDDATKNLLPPYSTQSKTETAITIYWCSQVQIGYIDANTPDPSDKNVFENIYNGIFVITSNNATYSHKPLLYNNDFTNLHNDLIGTGVAQQNLNMLNSIFTTHRGAGIYVKDFSLAPQILTDIHYLTVNNVPDDVNPAKFSNCDKAIVTTKMGADIRNTNVQDTKFGFMHTEADGQNYWIGDQSNDNLRTDANYLTNVHYGIDVNGLNSRIHINDNIIETNPAPLITTLANVYPRGIHVDELINYSKIINGNTEYAWQTELRQNKITLPSSLGKGIQLSNSGEASIIDRDSVLLTNNIKVPKYEYLGGNDYTGIQLDNVIQSTLLGNHVFGPSTTGIANTAKTTSAIKLITSPYNTYECNHIENTKYGWWVQDDCHTSNTSDLKNNDWNHHYYGMVFLPLGVDGTLGNQIGDGNDDYNFDFAGTYDNTPDNYRLYRIVNGINPQPYFYTNNILTTCGSNPTGNEFILTPTGALIDPCNSTYSFTPSPIVGENNTEEEENALQLLHDSVTFYANPAVAEWLAQMKLYNALDVDSITRLGNLTLHTFYDNLKYQNIGYINDANRKIVALVSHDNLADSTVFAEAMLDAKNTNEQNQNGALYEDNERIINTIYFKTIEYGSGSWDAEESTIVEALAKSCPLINGSAVYKARSLWHTMQPWIDYDDLNICNNTGQNKKSAANPFDFVLDNLENENNIEINTETKKTFTNLTSISSNIMDKISISPNPASTQITIKYNISKDQNAKLVILNQFGQIIQTIDLPNFAETVTTPLLDISNGLYQFNYIVDNKIINAGKLTILK